MNFKSNVDAEGALISNARFPRTTTNGFYIDQVRTNSSGILETWNGTAWIAPSGGGSSANGYGRINFHGQNSTILSSTMPNDWIDLTFTDGIKALASTNPTIMTVAVDFDKTLRCPARTFHVSPIFPNPIIDEHHWANIDDAVAFAYADDAYTPAHIIVYSGEYTVANSIPANILIDCMPGVKIMNSAVRILTGGRWTGYADVSDDQGSWFVAALDDVINRTPTVINGNRICVLSEGVKLHIKCNVLKMLVVTPSSDKGELIANFDIQVDCLEIGSVITTRVDSYYIQMQHLLFPIFDDHLGTYCTCEWKNGLCECPYGHPCLMTSVEMSGAIVRDMTDCRLQIRTNNRYPSSQFFISVGKVDVFGLRSMLTSAETPAGYVVGLNGNWSPKASTLRLTGFREEFDQLVPYQIANDGVLILENMNIKNAAVDGKIVKMNVLNGPICYISVLGSRLFSLDREITSYLTVNDVAVVRNSIMGNGFMVGNVPINDVTIEPSVDWA